ncbi:HNH endonuclease [Corynebacterium aquatimens]|uniref:HNH endonuclease signature motif containing protein n=2 Tax=Corynebacterium TaxID=1716 RepID=UPI00254077E3|nr:HNH endonuclease [Corynebacterium aquatimens]QYH20237.1 HNH endonuclease [Corynebacterium aquatimens]
MAKLLKQMGGDEEDEESSDENVTDPVEPIAPDLGEELTLEELEATDDWGSFGDEADFALLEPFGDPVEEVYPAEQTREPRKDTKLTADKVLRVPSRFGPPVKENLYPAFLTMISMVRSLPISAVRAPGAQVTFMITEDGRSWMPENPQIPSRALATYVNDAIARCHLLSKSGLTMHYGRERRLASDAQVNALLDVWGRQCAMPGCTHSRYIEIHHLREWADGGATDIENLIPLCSSCHSLVSHGSATIDVNGPMLEFSFSNGSRFRSLNRSLPEVVFTPQV